jgi:hypothetical protein
MHHALVDAFETEQNRSAIKKFVISMARHSRDEWNLFYGFMDEMHLKNLFEFYDIRFVRTSFMKHKKKWGKNHRH